MTDTDPPDDPAFEADEPEGAPGDELSPGATLDEGDVAEPNEPA